VNPQLRLGVIGAGRVGQIAHLRHYANKNDIELSLAEMRPRLRALVADRFGVKRTFSDHRALLAAGVDAVVVVVRRPATGAVVLDALRAGAHVLSEKPMALTAADAHRLVETARQAGRRYGVAYMKRCDRGVETLRTEFLRRCNDGTLGGFTGANAWSSGGADGSVPDDYCMTSEERPDGLEVWLEHPAWLSGAAAAAYEEQLNVHSHITNAVRYVLGAPFACHAVDRRRLETSIDAVTASGITVRFRLRDGRQQGAWREGMSLEFERGELRIDLPAPFASDSAGTVTQTAGSISAEVPCTGRGDAFSRQAHAFASWIRDGDDFPSEAADAQHDVEFAEHISRRLAFPAARV
jgi:predicted dehydrogenase